MLYVKKPNIQNDSKAAIHHHPMKSFSPDFHQWRAPSTTRMPKYWCSFFHMFLNVDVWSFSNSPCLTGRRVLNTFWCQYVRVCMCGLYVYMYVCMREFVFSAFPFEQISLSCSERVAGAGGMFVFCVVWCLLNEQEISSIATKRTKLFKKSCKIWREKNCIILKTPSSNRIIYSLGNVVDFGRSEYVYIYISIYIHMYIYIYVGELSEYLFGWIVHTN